MTDSDDWQPKHDNYPGWIVPFLIGFSLGGLAGFFLLR